MAELFSDIEKSFNSFFKTDYSAKKGFVVKTTTNDFSGAVKIKNGKQVLKGKWGFSSKDDESTIDHSLVLKSNGEHKLKSESDISKHLDGTSIKSETNWNSRNNEYEIETSITNKSVEDTTVGLTFKHGNTSCYSVTTHFARKFCP